jgi:hypothetical protein
VAQGREARRGESTSLPLRCTLCLRSYVCVYVCVSFCVDTLVCACPQTVLPEDLGLPVGFTDRKGAHALAVEAAKIARITALEGARFVVRALVRLWTSDILSYLLSISVARESTTPVGRVSCLVVLVPGRTDILRCCTYRCLAFSPRYGTYPSFVVLSFGRTNRYIILTHSLMSQGLEPMLSPWAPEREQQQPTAAQPTSGPPRPQTYQQLHRARQTRGREMGEGQTEQGAMMTMMRTGVCAR